MAIRKHFLIVAFLCGIVSLGFLPRGINSGLPNVPGYDVFPIIYQSNNFSGQDYDYVWSTYDQSTAPGIYTVGTDSNWGAKLFQYGWIQNPGVISTCTAFACQGDFGGNSGANPTAAYFITMMRDNYIPNKLQSNRTGVLIVPCAEGGTGYHLATPYTWQTNASAGIGTSTLSFAHDWGVAAGATVTDQTNPSAIPGGTTIVSFTANSVTLSANITSPGVSLHDSIQFTNTVGDWQAGGQLYEGCLARTNEAIAGNPGSRLVAVLGNGGEADSGYGVSTAQYTTFTQTMVADFRARATGGTNIPFLFGGMVPGWVASIGTPAINVETAISNLPSNVTRSAFVDPTGLAAATNKYSPYYAVSSITIPSNPCALTLTSTNTFTLVDGAAIRFAGFTGTTELNGTWTTTVVSQTSGVGASVTVPVNCTNTWTGSSGQVWMLRNITGLAINFIHFSSESQRELGNRYYTALVPFL